MSRSRGIRLQHPLEPSQELRHPISAKDRSARDRVVLLFVEPLVFVAWMVGIINLLDDVGDRELELMRPKPTAFIAWRKSDPPAQIQQDHRGVADDGSTITQE